MIKSLCPMSLSNLSLYVEDCGEVACTFWFLGQPKFVKKYFVVMNDCEAEENL